MERKKNLRIITFKDTTIIAIVVCVLNMLVSCSQSGEQLLNNYYSVTYSINPEKEDSPLRLDQYSVDSVCSLSLPDSTLSGFSKFIVKNNKIYLLDSEIAKTVFVFDLSGNYLYKLGERGRAQNEYIGDPIDFFVDDDDNVSVFDVIGKKILVWHNDRFSKSIDTRDYNPQSFGITSNNKLLFSSEITPVLEDNGPSLFVCDSVNKKSRVLIPANDKLYFMANNNTFFSNGKRLSHIPVFSDSVLVFDKDEVEKVVHFDFNGRFMRDNIPDMLVRTEKISHQEQVKNIIRYDGVNFLRKYQESDTFILLEYSFKSCSKYWLFNKNADKVVASGVLFDGICPFSDYYLRDNQIIAYVDDEIISMLTEYSKKEEFQKNLRLSSSQMKDLIEGKIKAPALFFITIK